VEILFCWFGIVLLIATAVLQFTRKFAIGCWLLVFFALALCAGLLFDLSHGVRNLGEASYHSDLNALVPIFGFLGLTIFAALRSNWRWLFWITWLVSAGICGIVVYLTFFWKVFS
jgi:hypothetical protein